MNLIIVLCFAVVFIFLSILWFIPTLLAWLFKRKYHIKLKIGRITVPKLIFRDVSLSKDGYSISIDEISFRSSFFNSEINKLVSVVIKSLKITNNAEEKRNVVVETILKPLLSKQNSYSKSDEVDEEGIHGERQLFGLKQQKILDFRDAKLPPSLIMFAQFMGVHIYDASLTFHNAADSTWNFTATASEVHADGAAGGPAKALVFSANIAGAKVNLMALTKSLAELQCSVLVEGTVKADGPLNVEKIHTVISNPTVIIQDDIYNFLQSYKKRKRNVSQSVTQDHLATLIPRFSPVIPKVNSRFSSGGASLPQVYVAWQCVALNVSVAHVSLLYLDKLKLDAKLEKGVLNLYLIISTLNITYNHASYFTWYSAALQHIKKSQSMQVKQISHKKEYSNIYFWLAWESHKETWWSRVSRSVALQACAELRALLVRASTHAANDARAFALGCSGLKVKFDQLLDTTEENNVASRQWSAEVLVDGGWTSTGPGGEAPGVPVALSAPPRRAHAWGSALLAVALVKWGSHSPKHSKVEAMMDCLRVEWSQHLAQTILAFVDCINDYRATSKPSPVDVGSSNTAVNVALSHINVFVIASEHVCLMTRIDAVTVEKSAVKSAAIISGMKMREIVPYKGNVPCQRSDEISSYFFFAKLSRIEHVPSRERHSVLFDFQFLENVEFEWSANLHLNIVIFIRALREFRSDLNKRRKEDPDMSTAVGKTKMSKDWRVSFKSETNLGLTLSKENSLVFSTDDMTIAYDHVAGLSIFWSQLKMILNGDEIITVEGYTMERVADDHDIRVERKANEGFVLTWNKVWSVNVDSIRIIFPYKHRFAEAVQGDFVSLFKWIKHIEEVLMEMSDDPFEKYGLGLALTNVNATSLMWFYLQVQELCKPHLFLPAGKVEQLYTALRQKDAQIYVQRCRAAPPPRTRLVACCLARLTVLALADPSIHGANNASDRLRDIDHDSPWPEEGLEFSTLWCRAVSVTCATWQLRLRDFPQPLLSMSDLRLWGTLLAAEERAPPRAVRTVLIDQGEPWGEVELERSMMPLKWYYDLFCEMTEYSYAFGPCWEPVIAQCNLGKLGFLGELKVFVRTASKYDDCRVLRVPGLRLSIKMGWLCVGDSRDHHAVAPCAPTRLPEYSSNQEHDSYRAFRSQGVELHLSMDTKPLDNDGPVLLLYGSTLRWFESLKLILSGTTRPTRRGRVFNNLRPRKPQLSRHYRNVSVSLTLHNLQRGIELLGVRVTCGSRHRLALVPGSDSLIRRARALWTTLYMNCDLNDVEIWLKTAQPHAEDKIVKDIGPLINGNICFAATEKESINEGVERRGQVVHTGSGGGGGACAEGMLAALVAEAGEAGGEAPVVFSDELAGAEGDAPHQRHVLDDDDAHTACLGTTRYPHNKHVLAALLQLHRDTDPRHLVHKLQTQVRESLARLRRLEKEYYLKNRSITGNDPVALAELKSLDDQRAVSGGWWQVNECKEAAWSLGSELDAMVSAWRGGGPDAAAGPRAPAARPHRYNEICFKYTKTSRSDDSVEHQLEVGYVRVTNLLPNEPFPEPFVFTGERLTKKFFNTMLKFCFPERDPDAMEDGEDEGGEGGTTGSGGGRASTTLSSKKSRKKNKDSNSNFYERAEKNKLFIYIKIPEVPVRVSYKGNKEKNLEDVRDLPLVLPTLEYHNVTWTWLDLLLATKNDTRRCQRTSLRRRILRACSSSPSHSRSRVECDYLYTGDTQVKTARMDSY
ncbi:unnamed protein product [Leptidea sinapis]|uniref:FMP27/BLTP2/Hobbit GFWDK motif-containing RBG unit domain-containing protein n=1 Tax=Leptidea sinapis TaxID=189913 RepID=A0A5E4Q7U3_9NEOP|nr:unnamed protein product [Leptidea sinapis]